MSEKSILHRYLIRRMAELPTAFSELRKHLASVAEKDGLRVTDEELDELAGRTEAGERKPEKAKSAPNSRRKSKSGDNTTDAV